MASAVRPCGNKNVVTSECVRAGDRENSRRWPRAVRPCGDKHVTQCIRTGDQGEAGSLKSSRRWPEQCGPAAAASAAGSSEACASAHAWVQHAICIGCMLWCSWRFKERRSPRATFCSTDDKTHLEASHFWVCPRCQQGRSSGLVAQPGRDVQRRHACGTGAAGGGAARG